MGYLISETTKEEREQIVREALGNIDGQCDGCMSGLADMYKFFSENTLDRFSFHDCVCSRMHYDGSSIIMDMEWMEVLPSHPNNPYEKAHQTKAGCVILKNPCLLKCTLIPWNEQKLTSKELAIDKIDVKEIEILEFNEEMDEEGYTLKIYGELQPYQKDQQYAFIHMIVHYSSSQDMFDELAGESWFEDERFSE